ncbi:MAG TPA: YafY family protein [Brevibacillus sp.]|nr:YafY family protein [Brevibacillus sp.]
MSKADNMLSILWLLRSGRRMTAQQLADELEIHIRTVYRCIDSLCASGVPIIAEAGHHGGYRIMDHFSKAPLLFNQDEQKALMHASIFARETGYPFTEDLNRAMKKLKQYTTQDQQERMDQHAEGLSVIHLPPDDRQISFLRTLEEALSQRVAVDLTYVKERDTESVTRRVDPYGIVYWKGSWYTVGFCHLRQAMRSFRADRIIVVERTDQVFERPADFSAREFLLGSLLPGSKADQSLETVRIQGHARALDELCKHWLFGHTLTLRTEEEAVFELGTESFLSYVPYLLLPYGKAIRIVEPTVLIKKMVEVAQGMAAHYLQMLHSPDVIEDSGRKWSSNE